MNQKRRAAALILSFALLLLALPVRAGAAGDLGSFLIDARSTDASEQELQVQLYQRDGGDVFQPDVALSYTCQVNRAAGETTLIVRPQTEGVWVEVDYLTDTDGDGGYELLTDDDDPVGDRMAADGTLGPRSGVRSVLEANRPYQLSARTLKQRANQVLEARRTKGSDQYLTAGDGTDLIYLISLHQAPAGGEEQTEYYYLRLYDKVILPSDVDVGAWYCGAVEFGLSKGLFSAQTDTFAPDAPATRAMMWTALAKLKGASLSNGERWYSGAQAWAMSNGLTDGSDPDKPVTREQVSLMLFRCAHTGKAMAKNGTGLERFTDCDRVSSWAAQGMSWAVEQGLVSGRGGGLLDPQGGLTRAELAVVLRQFAQTPNLA